MYIINPNDKITHIIASSEDSAYPATNVQDDFRTNPWKASIAAESTLTLTTLAGSEGIGLSYMNSGTVRVHVTTTGPVTVYNTLHTIDSNNPNLFVNYGLQSSACSILLTFSNPGADVPYCGVIRCSSLYEFINPQYGISEGLKDYSVVKRLNNGALYYDLKNIVRTFSGQIIIQRDSDFYTFMQTIVRQQGQVPMFWMITDLSNNDWAMFAECDGLPSGSHGYFDFSTISFSLLEAI